MKQGRSPFYCVVTASTQAYRGLSHSEDVHLFGASLLSVLYGLNRSLFPGEDDQVFKEWR